MAKTDPADPQNMFELRSSFLVFESSSRSKSGWDVSGDMFQIGESVIEMRYMIMVTKSLRLMGTEL